MQSFINFIDEARRNPELNPKISIYDILEKYHTDENVYISYVQDVGSKSASSSGKAKGFPRNAEGFKLGINPKSTYNTPNGIYTYPLKQAWRSYSNRKDRILEVPFAGENPFIYIIKPKRSNKVVDLQKYSSRDWDRDYDKLAKIIIEFFMTKNKMSEFIGWEAAKAILLEANNNSRNRSPGGRFWNMTRYTFFCLTAQLATSTLDKYFDEVSAGLKDRSKKANFSDDKVRFKIVRNERGKSSSTLWNKIFRNLGYDGVADKSGEGIIHPSEPTQAVFFDRTKLEVLHAAYNKGYAFKGAGKGSTFQKTYGVISDKKEVMLIMKNYLIHVGQSKSHMDAAQKMMQVLTTMGLIKNHYGLKELYIKGTPEIANMATADYVASEEAFTDGRVEVYPTSSYKNGEHIIQFGMGAVEFKAMVNQSKNIKWENTGYGDVYFLSLEGLVKGKLDPLKNWLKNVVQVIKIDFSSSPDYDDPFED